MYLSKCCFCIPLKNGLLLFAYLKILAIIGYGCMLWLPRDEPEPASEDGERVNFIMTIEGSVSHAVEMLFAILLVGGIHKQNYKIARTAYIFNVLLLGVEILIAVVYIPLKVYGLYVYERNEVWFDLLTLMCSCLLIMILQVYFVILIRSQLCSMREQCVSDPKRSDYCIQKPYVVY